MSTTEPIAALLDREIEELVGAWRDRCAAAWPGSPPSESLAEAVVAALAHAVRAGAGGSTEESGGQGHAAAADRLRASLEVDPDSAVSVEQLSVLRELLHRRALVELEPAGAMVAVETIGRLADVLVRAVTDRSFRRLEAAAFLDPLTGVGNRRALDRDAGPLLATAARHGRPFTVIVIDLDGLKLINDADGHAAGDEAIRRLATTLTRHLRAEDAVYRVGGDEFVLLLPETLPADVPLLLDRSVGQAPLFSFGVAGYPDDGLTLERLMDVADQQLFAARRRRRAPTPTTPAPSGGSERAVPRIATMPWPERAIEDSLYDLDEVLAARVTDEEGVLHVGVLVRPGVTAEVLMPIVLDRVSGVAGATPELLDLRVMPLGETAEHVVVHSNGHQTVTPGPVTGPAAPPAATVPPSEGQPPEPAAASEPFPAGAAATETDQRAVERQSTVSPIGRRRPVLERITSVYEGVRFSAEVVLRLDDREVSGRATGRGTRGGVQRVVAEATANGLAELDGRYPGVEFADVLATGDEEIAVVAVADLAVDDVVTGSAVVRAGNRLDAIARAVLDATNRRWSPGATERR